MMSRLWWYAMDEPATTPGLDQFGCTSLNQACRYSAFTDQCGVIAYSIPPPKVAPKSVRVSPHVDVDGKVGYVNWTLSVTRVTARPPVAYKSRFGVARTPTRNRAVDSQSYC